MMIFALSSLESDYFGDFLWPFENSLASGPALISTRRGFALDAKFGYYGASETTMVIPEEGVRINNQTGCIGYSVLTGFGFKERFAVAAKFEKIRDSNYKVELEIPSESNPNVIEAVEEIDNKGALYQVEGILSVNFFKKALKLGIATCYMFGNYSGSHSIDFVDPSLTDYKEEKEPANISGINIKTQLVVSPSDFIDFGVEGAPPTRLGSGFIYPWYVKAAVAFYGFKRYKTAVWLNAIYEGWRSARWNNQSFERDLYGILAGTSSYFSVGKEVVGLKIKMLVRNEPYRADLLTTGFSIGLEWIKTPFKTAMELDYIANRYLRKELFYAESYETTKNVLGLRIFGQFVY